ETDESRHGLEAQLAGSLLRHHQSDSSAVTGLRGVAGGYRAIGVKHRLELCEGFEGCIGARAFVAAEDSFRDMRLGAIGRRGLDFKRDNLIIEFARGLR